MENPDYKKKQNETKTSKLTSSGVMQVATHCLDQCLPCPSHGQP